MVQKCMVENFIIEKSGFEEFMVEKSWIERRWVEAWGSKVSGWNVLWPLWLGGTKIIILTYEYHILIQSILHNNYIPIPSYSYRAHSPVGVYKCHSLFPPSLPRTHKNLEPYRFRDRKFGYHGHKWARCKGCFLLPRDLKTASNQIDKLRCLCSHKYNLLSSEMLWESSWGIRELWK